MKTSKLGRYFLRGKRRGVANEVGEDLGAVRDRARMNCLEEWDNEEGHRGMVSLVDKVELGQELWEEIELERGGGMTLGYLPVENMAQRTK